MPVFIASKTRYVGSITPPSLNTETVVVEVGPEENDYIIEGYIDLSQLASGDRVTLCEYIAVDGVNYQKFICAEYSGPVLEPVVRFHTKTLLSTMKYRVTLMQTSGTLRSFAYGFIKEVMGEM